jgi:TonB-linked SusC/RagA family outer membrane protein
MRKRNHIKNWKSQFGIALFIVLAFSTFEIYGQPKSNALQTQNVQLTKIIKGKVLDEAGEGIPGVSIYEKGTKNGTISNVDGTFSLKLLKPGADLIFSFIGYVTQQISVKSQTEIVVSMKQDSKLIDEVVVVGYGTQKKVNLTGSVASVKMDEQMASRSLTNVSSGLSGLVPGLAVSQNSGMAGNNSSSLLIRGLGTVNNANPLVVVDGMPDVDINRINMNDIESISVLKDATSSAVYGSRAANGVILVTTKSGKNDGKTTVNFSTSYAVTQPTNFYNFLVDYPRSLTLHKRATAVAGLSQDFRDGSIEQWMAMSNIDPVKYPNTDWWDIIMRNGAVKKYNVSAAGGNEKSNFYISIGAMDETGLQINNDFKRYNARINYDYKIKKNLTIGARFDGNWSDMSYPYQDGFVNVSSGFVHTDIMSAVAGVYPQDLLTGNWGGALAYGENSFAANPLAIYTNTNNNRSRQEVNGSAFLDWEVFKGFKTRVDYSLRYNNQFTKSWNIPYSVYNTQTGLLVRDVYSTSEGVSNEINMGYKTQFNVRASYDKTIARVHKINALFVYSEEYWFGRYLMAAREERIHPSLTELDAAMPTFQTNSGNSSAEGLRSYIGRINYSAFDKYLLELNCRYDGSSKFLPGYQYGFFPSAALGWRFSEEEFLHGLNKVFSNGKLRASYGGLGNNSGVGRYDQKETMTLSNYNFAGTVAKGFTMEDMINPEFSWEATNILNIGLDLGFFNNHLTAEIDYYDRLTSGMIRPSDFSTLLSGYNAPKKNIGNLRNRGVEGNITWKSKISDFSYSANLNISYNQNRLESWNEFLSKGNVFLDMPYHFLYSYMSNGIAQSWNDIYNSPYQGQYFAPGDVLLKDLNGDGQITAEDKKAYPNIQQYNPTTNFGLNFSAAWKGIDIALAFQGATGRKSYWIETWNDINPQPTLTAFTEMQWNNSWSLENRDALIPRIVTTGSNVRGNSTSSSTFWLQDMSYLRLKNLQIAYNLSKGILKKIGIDNFRVFLSAENVFTLTAYRGIDPEKTGDTTNLYPLTKSFSIGLNIGI